MRVDGGEEDEVDDVLRAVRAVNEDVDVVDDGVDAVD